MSGVDGAYPPEDCATCGELDGAEGECPESKRPCGHHCNCVWIHDGCDWCGARFDDSGDLIIPKYPPTCRDHGGTDWGRHGLGCLARECGWRAASAFVIRCLTNPNCVGSAEVLASIIERREGAAS